MITDDWAEEIFCFSKDHEAAVIPACEKGSAAVLLSLALCAGGCRFRHFIGGIFAGTG